MTDPNVRHAVCPECHTHQPVLTDGRLDGHRVDDQNCPGSGEYPNRVVSGRYSQGSNFESCPAATGEARCPQFPDGAHRCAENRRHMTASLRPPSERNHKCTCGYAWSSLTGSIGGFLNQVSRPSEQLTERLMAEYTARETSRDDPVKLLEYALHLRMHGENAPGGNETWREFDQRVEHYLRGLPNPVVPPRPTEDEYDSLPILNIDSWSSEK